MYLFSSSNNKCFVKINAPALVSVHVWIWSSDTFRIDVHYEVGGLVFLNRQTNKQTNKQITHDRLRKYMFQQCT